MNRVIVKAALILAAGGVLTAGQQPATSIFTAQQADAGRTAYTKSCASCHMPDLSGDNERPPLVGAQFMTTWGARSTKEFLEYMTGAMPYGAPALEAESYASITAFILRSNGATAGEQPLNTSTDVLISSVTGPEN
jgi:mono/diheme cytochrome c family protein